MRGDTIRIVVVVAVKEDSRSESSLSWNRRPSKRGIGRRSNGSRFSGRSLSRKIGGRRRIRFNAN